MNKQLEPLFDRVEKALGTLVDSIAKYNPSVVQAQDLASADAELAEGLKELQTHQTNYLRIQELRASTARYDAQIKDTLRLLANTRRELVHASATVFPEGPNYEIRYDELLSYARRISKTTIPPVGALNAITAAINDTNSESFSQPQQLSAPDTAATTPAGGSSTPNGASTPQSQIPNGDHTPLHNNTTTSNTPAAANGAGGGGGTDLPEPLSTLLNPHSAYTFVPWPREEQIRHGSVAALAYLAEQGVDPEGYDPDAEAARREDEDRRMAEEQLRIDQEREEREREREKRKAEDAAEAWRRASVSVGAGVGAGAGTQPGGTTTASAVATVGGGGGGVTANNNSGGGGGSPTQPKAQFQFMGDDDDDDDD